jgi:hypothetical protein
VIGLRLMKIAHGGVEASHEVILMVQEKVDAAAEARVESRRYRSDRPTHTAPMRMNGAG